MKKTTLLLAALSTTGAANAATYDWATWTVDNTTNTATTTILGSSASIDAVEPTNLISQTNVSLNNTAGSGIDDTTFTAASYGLDGTATNGMDVTITLSGPAPAGRSWVLATGNFGHGTLGANSYPNPNYQLQLLDATDTVIAISSNLTEVGSFDHQWPDANFAPNFNDDVALDSSTGLFTVTEVTGVDPINSDIFIATLSSDVAKIRIFTTDTIVGTDTVNFTVGLVPEPSSSALLGLGLFGLLARRKR